MVSKQQYRVFVKERSCPCRSATQIDRPTQGAECAQSFWESMLYALFQAKSIFFRSLSPLYFPMQKVEKIRLRMSSLVVSPVSESR
jgi:hypothetical protein